MGKKLSKYSTSLIIKFKEEAIILHRLKWQYMQGKHIFTLKFIDDVVIHCSIFYKSRKMETKISHNRKVK